MKFAAAVGSAGYPHFTELNVCLLRAVFGNDLPIVIRDDRSQDTPAIEAIASRRDCYFRTSDVPLGHFGGDVQTFIDALALGEHEGCDVAIKMSQRAMVAHPDLRSVIESKFQDDRVSMVIAGRPDVRRIREGHKQFGRFPCLSDIVFMRVATVKPEFFKESYEEQVRNGKAYHDCFVELFLHNLANGPLKDHVLLAPELTEHRAGMPPLYLRRYQNPVSDYIRLAKNFGIYRDEWELQERANMTQRYDPRPKI